MRTPRVTLEQWRVLQAVVDCGGYAQAAAHLHRSQSSISYAVNKLQEQLGARLLEIEGRKARLTDAGESLLRRSRQLVTQAAEIEELAANLQRSWEPDIHLVIDAAFPTSHLVTALKEFAPLSRGTRVQLQEAVLSGTDEALIEGSADLVIGAQVPQGFLGNLLVEIEFVAVAHPGHELHRLGRPLTAADLRGELQVVIRDSGQHRRADSGWLGAEHRWTVTSFETAITTLCNGMGFGWMVRHRIEEQLSRGSLRPLPLRSGQIRRAHLYLIFGHPEEHTGPATHTLARILQHTVRGEA